MDSMLEVEPRQVTLLKGGGPIQRNGQTIGKTEKGQVWMAHMVFWGAGEKPALWMLDPADGNVGAWAKLKDTRGGGAERTIRFEG